MGVNIDDTDLSWRGPGGMEGRVNNGFGGGGDPGGMEGSVNNGFGGGGDF